MDNGSARSTKGNAAKRQVSVTESILQALKDFGPMTRSEVLAYLKLDRNNYGATLTRLCATDRAHISHYVNEAESQRPYPRAVYAYGPGKDAPKPKPKSRNQIVRENYAKRMNRVRMASVFNLGMKAEDIHRLYKERV